MSFDYDLYVEGVTSDHFFLVSSWEPSVSVHFSVFCLDLFLYFIVYTKTGCDMTKKKHRCHCMASVSDPSLGTKLLNTFLPATPGLQRATLPSAIPNFTVFDKVHMNQAQTVIER